MPNLLKPASKINAPNRHFTGILIETQCGSGVSQGGVAANEKPRDLQKIDRRVVLAIIRKLPFPC